MFIIIYNGKGYIYFEYKGLCLDLIPYLFYAEIF